MSRRLPVDRWLCDWRYAMVRPYVRGEVCELGCDVARVLREDRGQLSGYCGLDVRADVVGKLSVEFPKARFLVRDFDRDRLDAGGPFDTILMVAVLEHLWNVRFVFEQIVASLKPGGLVVITTPTPFGNDVVYRYGTRIGLFEESAIDGHVTVLNRHRFGIIAREFGLSIKRYAHFQLFCNQLVVLGRSGA